jgi:exodeoxyribonuclease VII large subunit
MFSEEHSNRSDPNQVVRAMGVREVVDQLQRFVEDCFPPMLAIEGEITRPSAPASGHIYFDLIEDNVKIPAAIWRSHVRPGVLETLQAGQRVRVYGQLTVYGPQGRYQIIVKRVEPAGVGAMLAALEALKKRLTAEGLFAPERKKSLPFMPQKVGLVTSPTGAAVRDIVTNIHRKFPCKILIAPARVQGVEAAAEITRGIQILDAMDDVDVIIVGRGGGSLEDLFCFNDERVVRAIAEAQTPIVSAVGHEVDHVLSDLAADVRAETPTAAGALVVPSLHELKTNLNGVKGRFARSVKRVLNQARRELRYRSDRIKDPHNMLLLRGQRLDELQERITHRLPSLCRQKREELQVRIKHLHALHPKRQLGRARNHLVDLSDRLARASAQLTAQRRQNLQHMIERLRALSPEAHLARGYALVQSPQGLIRKSSEVALDSELRIILWRGALKAKVTGQESGPFDPAENK